MLETRDSDSVCAKQMALNPKCTESFDSAASWEHRCLWISFTKGCPCVTNTCSWSDRTSVLALLWRLPRWSTPADACFHITDRDFGVIEVYCMVISGRRLLTRDTHFWMPSALKPLVALLSNFKVCFTPSQRCDYTFQAKSTNFFRGKDKWIRLFQWVPRPVRCVLPHHYYQE